MSSSFTPEIGFKEIAYFELGRNPHSGPSAYSQLFFVQLAVVVLGICTMIQL